ncbi:MAG: dGTPase [Campylobacterota bacterium]|nr:dGTPase [Campylobacterota bacterium]
MIDYHKKLTTHREFYPVADLDWSVESDRGRIISSPAFRRLQKRTQVFALELNAAVRSRLTHSLEVSQTARFIAKTILKKLKSDELKELENAFISTTEMASLLHDIGNPPFGHFGETAINEWFVKKGLNYFKNIESDKKLKETLIKDLSCYDGNAQAIRIVHKLQRLNLSYTQTASIIKYTRGAFEDKSEDTKFSYLEKKPGFFFSEKEFVKTVSDTLDIKAKHRFPLTYIMEAADDISYLSADIEDAVDKGILTLDSIYNLIKDECQVVNQKYNTNTSMLFDIVDKNYKKAKAKEDEPYQFNMFLTLTRAQLIFKLVEYVSDIYIQNHSSVFDGSFNNALLESNPKHECSQAVEVLQNISIRHIYNNKQVQALELKGYRIIQGLFDIYEPLLALCTDKFQDILNNKKSDCLICTNLLARLSKKHLVAYKKSIDEIQNNENKTDFSLLEWYYRARLIIDYISGMTDDYALEEYKNLSAI